MRTHSLLHLVFFLCCLFWVDVTLAQDHFFAPQDTSSSSILDPQPDTTDISRDSLEKLMPYLDNVQDESDRMVLFLYMLAIALSTLFSEDLACIGAGLMVAQGILGFWPAAAGAIGGIFLGDFSLYFAGRILGNSVFKIAPFKWFLKKESVEAAEKWFQRRGPIILVVSRFIPGSRFPVYLSAGLLRTSFWKFALYFGGTVLLWTPIFVWLSVFAGNEILTYYDKYDEYAVWILLAALLVLYTAYKFLSPLLTVQGRRVAWKKIRGWFQ